MPHNTVSLSPGEWQIMDRLWEKAPRTLMELVLLQRVYRGSVGLMVNTLADGRGLTQADIDELTAILEKARREQT